MKRMCAECGKRPARFRSSLDTRIRADKRHDVCRQCWKAQKDRNTAK